MEQQKKRDREHTKFLSTYDIWTAGSTARSAAIH